MQPEPTPLDPQYRWVTVAVLSLVTMIAFQAIAVATAMPTAVRAVDGMEYYGWGFSAFLIINVVGMTLAGLWGDRFGPQRAIFVGLAAFGLGLILTGVSTVMWLFVAGRALQGLGAGLCVVSMYVLIGHVYAEAARPRMFAYLSAAWVLPALIGPFVAGALAEHGYWRLVFLGLVPMVVLVALAIWNVLSVAVDLSPHPVRYSRLGFAISVGIGLTLLQAAFERIGKQQDLATMLMLAGGALMLWYGLRALWPAGTVRFARGIPAIVFYRGVLTGAFFGLESLVPLTLDKVHGYEPIDAGLPLLVAAVGWSVASWIQGRVSTPRHVLVRIGAVLVTLCAASTPVIVLVDNSAWLSYPIWIVGGLGMGLAISSLNVLLLNTSEPAQRGTDSSAFQMSEAVMASLTIGIGGALVAASVNGVLSFTTAIATHDVLLTALALLAVLFCNRLVKHPDGAPAAPVIGGARQ